MAQGDPTGSKVRGKPWRTFGVGVLEPGGPIQTFGCRQVTGWEGVCLLTLVGDAEVLTGGMCGQRADMFCVEHTPSATFRRTYQYCLCPD